MKKKLPPVKHSSWMTPQQKADLLKELEIRQELIAKNFTEEQIKTHLQLLKEEKK